MKLSQVGFLAACLTGLFLLGGCITSEQMKAPSARTVENKINALKTDRGALIAYLKATTIPYSSAPIDKTNQYWMDKLATHAGLTKSKMYQGDTLVTFSKETFPFTSPYALTGTPFVTGQIIYDRSGRYLGSYILSGLTGI
ncbi:hypothetical protein BH09VER1_BH09VER1_05370 [soil metagenome]